MKEKAAEMTIKEAARLSGVSVRTLRYYDEIGLLRPGRVTEAGYRLYREEELARLQQILLYRELEFSLGEIAPLLEKGGAARKNALKKQRQLLLLKQKRLQGILDLTEKLLKGEKTMEFSAFDKTEWERGKEEYAREARERWGGTEAYRESERRAAGYDREDWETIQAGMEEIFRRFAEVMELGFGSPEAQALVQEWQAYITRHFYPCTGEILQSLGQMYTGDERFRQNFEKTAPGLAEFLSQAIAEYCRQA